MGYMVGISAGKVSQKLRHLATTRPNPVSFPQKEVSDAPDSN